jgi:hypothetical protein
MTVAFPMGTAVAGVSEHKSAVEAGGALPDTENEAATIAV